MSQQQNNQSVLFNAELKLKKVLEKYEAEVIDAEQAIDMEMMTKVREEAIKFVERNQGIKFDEEYSEIEEEF